MERIPVKQLIKIGLATAPLMGLMLVTPIFVLSSGLHHINFFVLWLGVTGATTLAWIVNIAFLNFISAAWVRSWIRILVVGSIMYGLSFFIFFLVAPHIKIDRFNIEIIRLINILAVNTIIFIITDLIITKENKNKYELEISNLRLANLEAEYKLLKDQINPHFLFNALSTAKALIKKQAPLAEDYIVRLSEFLRASINNNRKTVTLKEELALCNEFIALNQIRFGNALQVENKIVFDTENYSVPYFSILSLIENSIKHNMLTAENPLHITLSATEERMEVKNNKQIKFVVKDPSKTGLQNLNNRYKLLNAPEIIIQETDTEFSVQIALLKK